VKGLRFYIVKLIDFDVSKMLDENADHTLKRGTNRWMAPEVWGLGAYKRGGTRQTAPYGTSIDVYSFGMTCYEVITGLIPFHDLNNKEIEGSWKGKSDLYFRLNFRQESVVPKLWRSS
jgi:serine/threonine protein kinase